MAALAQNEPNELAMGYGAPNLASINGANVAAIAIDPHAAQPAAAQGVAADSNTPTASDAENDVISRLGKFTAEKTGGLVGEDMIEGALEGGFPVPGIANASGVVGACFGFYMADRKAKRQICAIVDQYREEIAGQLQIDPAQVGVAQLFQVAKNNPIMREAIVHIQDEKESHPFINISSLLGMAGGAIIGTPLLPVIGTLAGGMIGGMVGNWLGDKALSPEQARNPLAQIEAVRAKQQQNQPVTELDIFRVRVAQNPALYEQIKNQYDESFYELSERDQTTAMYMNKQFRPYCQMDARACNFGGNVDDLLFGTVRADMQAMQTATPGGWANRMERPGTAQNYTQMLAARRAEMPAEPDRAL